MEKFNESMIGRKVVFINYEAHRENPLFYPTVGTIGTIVSTKGTRFENYSAPFAVQWKKGTTSDDDLWLVGEESIILLEEDNTKYNSIDFFLKKLMFNLCGLSATEWVVTSLGSGRDNNDYYWSIVIKNTITKKEKRIKIPCYKD